MTLHDFLSSNGWTIVRSSSTPEIQPEVVDPSFLPLSNLAKRYLGEYRSGIYGHQASAIEVALSGQNVCIATATASGKSLVFYATAIELLQRTGNGTILAIYPLKALTDDQEQKWLQAVANTRASIEVGRIDGSVPVSKRRKIVNNASVIIMTPDVVHAWLLSNLNERGVRNFLASLQMVVIDEAHTYSGVFGSNAAYLFRRIHHIAHQLGASPRYIAASATISDPIGHMLELTGLDFTVIGSDADSSGRKARTIMLVEPPPTQDILTSLTDLMHFVVGATDHQFITFVDSRKQTEQLASVMRRTRDDDSSDAESIDPARFQRENVYPYRAGYEAEDRKRIEENLRKGQIRGVISTSALELGVDIQHLTLGILYGIPNSATSYYQRIGRVGRHREGTIIIVNNGSVLSNRIFRNPEELDRLPLNVSALYLDNRYIQYIHTMCLARTGGEHDQASNSDATGSGFEPQAPFPDTFVKQCDQERIGEIEPELQPMKGQAGDNPNYTFPLRDCGVQFRVMSGSGYGEQRLGTLSHSQMMREAYPGAVYYYQAAPYRVWQIRMRDHLVLARPERRYTTRPNLLPVLIYPNLTTGNVYGVVRYGNLVVVETNLQIRERINGLRERRGPNEFTVNYPLDPSVGCYFDREFFTRDYFSSGVLMLHPALNGEHLERERLGELLFEAFLMQIPFERMDLHFGSDSIRANREPFVEGDRFLCVYDQTYGSLRLTSRLLEPDVLFGTFEKALEIAQNDPAFSLQPATMRLLETMLCELQVEPSVQTVQGTIPEAQSDNLVPVIMPGSIGLSLEHNNEEFRVENIVFTPSGLRYRGRRAGQMRAKFDDVMITMPVAAIQAIPDVSETGFYDLETGEIVPSTPAPQV